MKPVSVWTIQMGVNPLSHNELNAYVFSESTTSKSANF